MSRSSVRLEVNVLRSDTHGVSDYGRVKKGSVIPEFIVLWELDDEDTVFSPPSERCIWTYS